MGCKKQRIPADSKEIKETKMKRRHHLLARRTGLGFHLMRSCKWSKQSESVATLLWSSYILHCLGCHTFCFDDQVGIESMGKSRCAKDASPPRIYDKEEFWILQDYIFNPRIQKDLPRLVYFTSSFLNESFWNVVGIYRDKTIHYKFYNVLYEMGYLDWNENRLQKVQYKYKTRVQEWRILSKDDKSTQN